MSVTPVQRSRVRSESTMAVNAPSAIPPKDVVRTSRARPAPAYERSSSRVETLTPPTSRRTSTPLGPWALTVPETRSASGAPSVVFQQKAFDRIAQSGIPGREELLMVAIRKRSEGSHAYYRGIADSRVELMAKEMPASRYAGKAGFVLSTGDAHLYQPTTLKHSAHGLMMGVGDSDRIGFGPYEWEVRSLLTSVELEGRTRKFPAGVRQEAMEALLESYTNGIRRVAKAGRRAESVAKDLRVTSDQAPEVFEPALKAAASRSRGDWLDDTITVKRGVASLTRVPGALVDLPAGRGATDIREAIAAAIPAYARQLPDELRARLKGLEVVDVAMPIKGNASLGYGRYRVLLAPKDGETKRSNMVVLEFKEQLPSALSRLVDPKGTEGFGKDQATRAVELFRLGSGRGAVPSWGHVELPRHCGVESTAFTVKELRESDKGPDVAALDKDGFVAMAAAQGRMMAAFQSLGGLNGAKDGVGGAKDILADLEFRPDFVDQNLRGAVQMAIQFEAEARLFKDVHR